MTTAQSEQRQDPRRRPRENMLRAPEVRGPPEYATFFDFAGRNPCHDCQSANCCSYVQLDQVRPVKFRHFDYLRYLANFEGVEILVQPSGVWGVFLRQPCSRLNPETLECRVHGTVVQPKVCSSYNPYDCWYKWVHSRDEPGHPYVRLDAARLDRILRQIAFDSFGRARGVPDSATIGRLAESDSKAPVAGHLPETTAEERGASPSGLGPESPCADCSAVCCRTLFFRRNRPNSFSDMDFVQYLLGFPSVSYVISDSGWRLAVRADCRHLDRSTRICLAFGTRDRPKRCEFLNEWQCALRTEHHLGAKMVVRVCNGNQWEAIRGKARLNRSGAVDSLPSMEKIREVMGALGGPEAP